MSASKVARVLAFASLVACSASSDPSGEPTVETSNGASSWPASTGTRSELGVDHWAVAASEGSAEPAIVVIGYGADSTTVRTRVAWKKGSNASKEWIDFAIETNPPMMLRFEPGLVPNEAAFEANEAAKRITARLAEDLGSASLLTSQSAALRFQSPDLIKTDGPLTHAQYMQLCLRSPYHSLTYDQCNAMFYGP